MCVLRCFVLWLISGPKETSVAFDSESQNNWISFETRFFYSFNMWWLILISTRLAIRSNTRRWTRTSTPGTKAAGLIWQIISTRFFQTHFSNLACCVQRIRDMCYQRALSSRSSLGVDWWIIKSQRTRSTCGPRPPARQDTKKIILTKILASSFERNRWSCRWIRSWLGRMENRRWR